jgi:hypothetical protein
VLDLIERQAPLNTLAPLSPGQLAAAESAVLASAPIETGEPGYPYGRRFVGVVAVGELTTSGKVVFASFEGGEVSNDHRAFYEVLVRPGAEPALISARRYFGDVAGIEFLSAPGAAFLTAGLLYLLTLLVVGTVWLIRLSSGFRSPIRPDARL